MPATHSGENPAQPRRRRVRIAVAAAALALVSPALTIAGTTAPAAALTLPIVAAGGGHSCSIMADQSVWCWGQNTTGQLGNGTIADSTVPVQVAGLPPAIGVAGGHDHTCAIDTGHHVWCWGANAFGQLGNGTTSVDSTAPVQAGTFQGLQVSAGDGFSCAVTAMHTARCWGDNNFGELGDGTTNDSSTPMLVKGLTGVTAVAAGYFHACALLSTGRVWCWGDNGNGELGDGSDDGKRRAGADATGGGHRDRRGRRGQLCHHLRRRPSVLGQQQRRPARHRQLHRRRRPDPGRQPELRGTAGRAWRGLRLRARQYPLAERGVLGRRGRVRPARQRQLQPGQPVPQPGIRAADTAGQAGPAARARSRSAATTPAWC